MSATPPGERELTPEQRKMVTRLRQFKRRYDRQMAKARAIEDERTDQYLAARAVTPPLTYAHIADLFGVTEAAVMQKVRRGEKAAAGAVSS